MSFGIPMVIQSQMIVVQEPQKWATSPKSWAEKQGARCSITDQAPHDQRMCKMMLKTIALNGSHLGQRLSSAKKMAATIRVLRTARRLRESDWNVAAMHTPGMPIHSWKTMFGNHQDSRPECCIIMTEDQTLKKSRYIGIPTIEDTCCHVLTRELWLESWIASYPAGSSARWLVEAIPFHSEAGSHHL